MSKRIVVLVSGGGTNLQSLLDAQARGTFGDSRIAGVIASRDDAYALVRAENHGVPHLTLRRGDYPDVHAYSLALLDAIRDFGADLVVLAGFLTIVDETLCRAYPNRIINIHPSLIPSFCGPGFYGLRVHEAALAKGVKVSGATVHFVTEECDGGPIILQKAVCVQPDDTPETLQKRIMKEAEQVLLPEAVRLFCEDRLAVENGVTRILSQEGSL